MKSQEYVYPSLFMVPNNFEYVAFSANGYETISLQIVAEQKKHCCF